MQFIIFTCYVTSKTLNVSDVILYNLDDMCQVTFFYCVIIMTLYLNFAVSQPEKVFETAEVKLFSELWIPRLSS